MCAAYHFFAQRALRVTAWKGLEGGTTVTRKVQSRSRIPCQVSRTMRQYWSRSWNPKIKCLDLNPREKKSADEWVENAEKCFTSVRDYLLGSEGEARSILEPTDGAWISVSSIELVIDDWEGFGVMSYILRSTLMALNIFKLFNPWSRRSSVGLRWLSQMEIVSGRVILYIF